MNGLYRVRFNLKHDGCDSDTQLLVVAADFDAAVAYAQTMKNSLRPSAVYQELTIRDVVRELEDVHVGYRYFNSDKYFFPDDQKGRTE